MSQNRHQYSQEISLYGDLTKYPTTLLEFTQNGPFDITLPDMHANPLARIYRLIQLGLISMPEAAYKRLVQIYYKQTAGKGPSASERKAYQKVSESKTPQEQKENYSQFVSDYFKNLPEDKKLTAADIREFIDLLDTISIDHQLASRVTLIDGGDEVADRGSADPLTLLYFDLVHALQSKGAHCLISNHGMEFVHAYEPILKKYKTLKDAQTDKKQIEEQLQAEAFGHDGMDHLTMGYSMLATAGLLRQGHISWLGENGLIELIEKSYKPLLTPLHYTLCKDEKDQDDTISIRSHAPIDVDTIVAMARALKIPGYKFALPKRLKDIQDQHIAALKKHTEQCAENIKTPRQLAQLIDQIVAKVKAHVANNTLSSLYTPYGLCIAGKKDISDQEAERLKLLFPFPFSVWNRNYKVLNRHSKPFMEWTHGHDDKDPEAAIDNIFSIDGTFGKGSRTRDTGVILYSQPTPIPQQTKVYRKKHICITADELKEQLVKQKTLDTKRIISCIRGLRNNADLIALHQHLQGKEFDYLREKTGLIKMSRWRSADTDGNKVSTSRSWAMIEKAFELQLSLNISKQTRKKSSIQVCFEKLRGSLPDIDLSKNNFFTVHRTAGINLFRSRFNRTYSTLLRGNEEELKRTAAQHFNKHGFSR